MIVELDGSLIKTELDFHKQIASKLDFGPYYGNNLDALWDRLSTDVGGPITLIWKNSSLSKQILGDVFVKIVAIFHEVQDHDLQRGSDDLFQFRLD